MSVQNNLKQIALAQLPVHVGDVMGNAQRIAQAAKQAHQRGQRILLCPELALLGYPADDLLQRRGLPQLIEQAMQSLLDLDLDLLLVLGYPEFTDHGVFNAAAVLWRGQKLYNYRKQCLPNTGVFDERRHFESGDQACVFEFESQYYGLSICEDIWQPEVAAQAAAQGAKVLLNINASPFDLQKRAGRRQVIQRRIAETGMAMAYVNAVGGQDDVVFDGDSQLWDSAGVCLARAEAFREGLIDPEEHGDFTEPAQINLLYQALLRSVRDYVGRNGFKTAFVGLSGGIDSAVTLAIAVDALGADGVKAVTMPSRYSADISASDAAQQAAAMGIDFREIAIEPAMLAYEQMLSPSFAGLSVDTTEENLQARIRGGLLMALANKFSGIVLTTGNKSEMAVGYCTLYGDMCGGFAPLKDVYKLQVYDLARYRNTLSPVIPERVITRPPSAELRPDQRDDESLPAYERLDAILEAYIEGEASVAELYTRGFDRKEVDQIVRLVRLSEYKRRQAAPGPKVSVCAFGRERRYPITAQYAGL
ncbi:MAG: NAD+ synthase [Oceanococcus sp.]